MRTVKDLLQKEKDPNLALMAYRATPLTNGYSPAQLSMGQQLRTTVPVTLSSLNPGWTDITKLKKEEQKKRQRLSWYFNKRHSTSHKSDTRGPCLDKGYEGERDGDKTGGSTKVIRH